MYVLTHMIDRAKAFKLYTALSVAEQKEAYNTLDDEFKSTLVSKLDENDRINIYNEIIKGIYSLKDVKKPQLVTKGDLIVVLFTFFIVVLIACIVVIPFWIFNDVITSIRVSEVIGIALLFYLGYRWGKVASKNKIRSGLAISAMGFLIVLATAVLGGYWDFHDCGVIYYEPYYDQNVLLYKFHMKWQSEIKDYTVFSCSGLHLKL